MAKFDLTDETLDSLVQLAGKAMKPEPLEPGVTYHKPDTDRRFTTEGLLPVPTSKRGTVTVHEHASLIAYAAQHLTAGSRFYCDQHAPGIVAVLDGHEAGQAGAPGWGRHRVAWAMKPTADYQNLLRGTGQSMTQVEFAGWLKDNAHVVLEPAAPDLRKLALDFQARRDASVRSVANLENGAVTFQFDAAVKTTNQVEMPTRILFRLPAFIGFPPVDIEADLRYRIDSTTGKLTFHYRLVESNFMSDMHFQRAVDDVRAAFNPKGADEDATKVMVLMGTAPGVVGALEV